MEDVVGRRLNWNDRLSGKEDEDGENNDCGKKNNGLADKENRLLALVKLESTQCDEVSCYVMRRQVPVADTKGGHTKNQDWHAMVTTSMSLLVVLASGGNKGDKKSNLSSRQKETEMATTTTTTPSTTSSSYDRRKTTCIDDNTDVSKHVERQSQMRQRPNKGAATLHSS
jgi:hypothetical protein